MTQSRKSAQTFDAQSLANAMDTELNSSAFKDYCPNGLQLQNQTRIKKIVCGVTANADLIAQAKTQKAQAILVHHGIFWKGEDARLTGFRYQRVRELMAADIALFAYHLPLDAHATLGNNAQLARVLGIHIEGTLPAQPHVMFGKIPTAQKTASFSNLLTKVMRRAPLVVGDAQRNIQRVAWCTGAGQSFFEDAIAQGVDAFITGEVNEQTVHIARETGVTFIAAGHHATERYGVQALGAWLSERFGIETQFVDIDSPV